MQLVAGVQVVHLPLGADIPVNVAALRVLDPRLQLVQIDEAVRVFVDLVHNHAARVCVSVCVRAHNRRRLAAIRDDDDAI